MKKGISLLIALLMLLCVGNATALAADSETPSGAEAAEKSADVSMSIDNKNLYDGMDKTYSHGYMPTVANNTARIVLPLLASDEIKNNAVNVTVDLGDPSSAPFEFKNYDKTIKLSEHSVNGGKSATSAYVIDLTLPLAENRTNGRYPVTINVKGKSADGAQFSQAYILYVTINDVTPSEPAGGDEPGGGDDYVPSGGGDDYVPSGGDGGSGSEEAATQPKVMISGYTVNPSPVEAGKKFKLSVKLQNTNEKQAMKNVKVTINGESTDIICVDKTNSFYFNKIGTKSSVAINTKMLVQQTTEPKPQKVILSIEYEGKDGAAYTSEESIVIQVKQPVRLEYDEPDIPDTVNAGDTMSLSFNVMNMGRGTVYNVRAELEAPGLIPEGSAFLGNLESGASKKEDMYVFVGTLDAGESEGGGYGPTNGKITLTYEDEFGEVSKKEIAFTTTIDAPVIDTSQDEVEEQPKTQSQWWISAIILAAVIVAGLGVWYFRKKRIQKRAEEDEDV